MKNFQLGHKRVAGIVDADRQGGTVSAFSLGSGFSRRLQLANLMEGFEFLHAASHGVKLPQTSCGIRP